jgi:cyanophycin synthetase
MLLDAVVQKPPTVKGDGRSPIRSLVRQANIRRLEKGACVSQGLLSVDPDMRQTLAAQGLKLSSVPRAGQTVVLKTAINENAGADNRTATPMLCQSILDEGALAARVVGVRLAGVDVITTNPSVPLRESGGAIIEVNTTPGFYWHYQKADGQFPVAFHVLQFMIGRDDDCNERQANGQKFSMMA